MANLPAWELLADALVRVRETTGVSETEAKTRLCRAMADYAVCVTFARLSIHGRSKVLMDALISGRIKTTDVVVGGRLMTLAFPNMFISHDLGPDDLDWVQSRPLKLASIGPAGGLTGSWTDPPFLVLSTHDVEEALCAGVRENADKKQAQTSTATDGEEDRAISALAEHLKSNRDPTRKEARAWLHKNGLSTTARGFQSRVWPKARKLAGLGEKAPPGAKKKSLR
jgi:hypothetical protein